MDWEDYGFERVTERSRYVECIICGRHGGGFAVSGITAVLFKEQGQLNRWQRDCLKPHVYMCSCGKAFPKPLALASHCAQNRRHSVPGHGSMERVGY
jgi:hypothetical protein